MATACLDKPAVLLVSEPEPRPAPLSASLESLPGWEKLTDENKRLVWEHYIADIAEHWITRRLAEQGDEAAVAEMAEFDKRSEDRFQASRDEKRKEREKLDRTLERVRAASNCAYRQVLAALEDRPEARDAFSAQSELNFYEEVLQNKNYDLSRIRGLKTHLEKLTKIWFAKALAETPADEVAGQP